LWGGLAKAGVSERTQTAIRVGMEIDPSQRPQNMTEFRKLLGFVSTSKTITSQSDNQIFTPKPLLPTPLEYWDWVGKETFNHDLEAIKLDDLDVNPFSVLPPPRFRDWVGKETFNHDLEAIKLDDLDVDPFSGLEDLLGEGSEDLSVETREITLEEFVSMLEADPSLVLELAEQFGLDIYTREAVLAYVIAEMKKIHLQEFRDL
jgi:hypothetical protein